MMTSNRGCLGPIPCKAPTAPHQADDLPEMTAAIDWLAKAKLTFTRPSPHQLKIGSLSYYPRRGTMNFDSQTSELSRGPHALKILLEDMFEVELPAVD